MRHVLPLAATLAAAVFAIGHAGPASAQPHQKMLIIYGNDKCPQSNGEEIVVCERRTENDRYRIPSELRQTETPLGTNDSPVSRVAAMDAASAPQTGLDTCSTVGAGGHTGCFKSAARSNKAARREDAAEAATPDK